MKVVMLPYSLSLGICLLISLSLFLSLALSLSLTLSEMGVERREEVWWKERIIHTF